MIEKLLHKESHMGIIGLGYVGLPLAIHFGKKLRVIGFDVNADKIKKLRQNIDPGKEVPSEAFSDCDVLFSHDLQDLKQVTFFVVAVPTPIDEYNQPDLSALIAASDTVAKVLKKGDVVVFESTVYPGCTEEKCIPILEQGSGLRFGTDFTVGYSPERINPGDKEHMLHNVIKIVSGSDKPTLDLVAKVYELVVEAGVHRASSIKVAEAAKVIENTQRDLNIALMNELSMIFDKLGINTFEVLEAAGTKWNFMKYFPGLVGGHCIGVDPYYLTFKANHMGHFPKVILSGREINDSMGAYVARKVVQLLTANKIDILTSRILILGATFKENVADIRNSKVVDVLKELDAFHVQADIVDPYADPHEFEEEYGYTLTPKPNGPYDAVILAVAHKVYRDQSENYFKALTKEKAVFIDIKGLYRSQIHDMVYWSL